MPTTKILPVIMDKGKGLIRNRGDAKRKCYEEINNNIFHHMTLSNEM